MANSSRIDRVIFEQDHTPINSTPMSVTTETNCFYVVCLHSFRTGQEKQMGMGDISNPENIRSLVRKIRGTAGNDPPGLLDEKGTPSWATRYDPSVPIPRTHSELLAQTGQIAGEREISPTQAQAARNARLTDEHAAFYERTIAEQRARERKSTLQARDMP